MNEKLIMALYLLGTLFLISEILLPGAIVGTIGTILLLSGTYFGAKAWGMPIALTGFLSSLILCGVLFYTFLRSPLRKLIFNEESLAKEEPTSELPLGLKGATLTALRPSGKAAFSVDGRERHLDVLTEGDFIEKDQSVKVLRIEGSKIIVSREL